MGDSTLNIVVGSDYLHRQAETKQRGAVLLLVPIALFWLASMLASVGILALSLVGLARLTAARVPLWVNGVALAMILLDYALLPTVERLLDERDHYRKGRRGEEATVEALQKQLDGDWTLFCNVVLPGAWGDVDAVLVGPAGVYVLEIKSYRGRFRNEGDRWWRRYGPGWRRLDKSPSRQAKANAAALGEYLRKVTGVRVWVESRVVWAGPGRLSLYKPAVYVWFLDRMAAYAEELARAPARPESIVGQVRKALRVARIGSLAEAPRSRGAEEGENGGL